MTYMGKVELWAVTSPQMASDSVQSPLNQTPYLPSTVPSGLVINSTGFTSTLQSDATLPSQPPSMTMMAQEQQMAMGLAARAETLQILFGTGGAPCCDDLLAQLQAAAPNAYED